MKTQMRKWGVLVVLLAVLVSGIAAALVEPKHLSLETRKRRAPYPIGVPASTLVTVGQDNVSVAVSSLGIDGGFLDSGVAVDAGPKTVLYVADGGDAGPGTVATNIEPPTAPSQLAVVLVDVSANSTLTCASVTITGFNQFGAKIVETVSTVTETAQYTNNAFSSVSSVQLTGCAGGTSATDDYLRISGSVRLALPTRARQVGDVISVCAIRPAMFVGSTTRRTICLGSTTLNTDGALDLTYNVVKLDDSDITPLYMGTPVDGGFLDSGVAVDGGFSGNGLVNGDHIYVEELPNPALP